MIRWRIVIVGWIGIWMGFIHVGFSQVRTTEIDSTYWQLSLPELQNHKAYYMLELQALQEEKRNLIQRGIEDGERLLEMKPNIQVVDKILIRLADLYYYQEKDEYISQMELFDRLLEQELIEDLPEEPRLEYERSMQLYQRIIDEFPNSELVDDAVYNKGFLFEEMGENQKSNQIYQHLIRAYPESRYVPEAHMRLGEYSFNPPVNDIHGAIGFYEKVLQYRDNPRYDEALYKLGWSYYRLSEYPVAISYFTTLVEGSHAIEQIDELALSVRADLREEAVEYIAISFIDFGGPFKLRKYLQGIGEPAWGWDALKKLGDIYMQEKEEYVDAIAAYQTLLAYAPNAPEAPLIQRKIVDCYHVLNDETQAFNFRQELFLTYKTDGNWWNEMTDDTAKLLAYKLAEQALRENINSLIKRAEELSSDALYQEAVDQGKMYLETFPEELHAYMIRWNMALILDTKLNSYKEALQEYLTICMVYHNKEYETFAREKGLSSLKDAAENAIVVADSVVQRDWRSANDDQSAQQGNGAEEPQPLTAAESWLAMAYDNYIKL
ncbi:MAG: tetratricopeptide repeat protein, partial [Deltaproteobacteria bacterium]|nr:tetratricopeptide repeat protein [Deltaproteobacteria bacterium]